ncbi:MAG: CoA transferase [Gemmatimonadaceae bacterium]|nr:CoA transferase [Gemmatimonadaceae bacterium]
MKTLPLEGIRVLDFTRVLAGPLCTMMLGDLGAQVIKVERPENGDDTRGWGPPFAADGQSAYFRSTNRNKLSIALNLKDMDDNAVARSLVKSADIVIDNYLPEALSSYGLDKGAELASNTKLIWCTISGFGPGSDRPGYDYVVQAEAGWMAINGPEAGPPMKTGVALADVITGKDAAVAILAALAGRDAGRPIERQINISLNHSATAALVNVAQNALVSGTDAKRWGNAHPNLVPYQLFAAADRALVMAVGTDAQWTAAAQAIGLDALAADPDLARNAGRLAQRERVVTAIADRLRTQPAALWMARLQAARVPCGLVRTVREAIADYPASPVTGIASVTGGQIRYAPPSLDQHGELIRQNHWSVFDHVPILAEGDV